MASFLVAAEESGWIKTGIYETGQTVDQDTLVTSPLIAAVEPALSPSGWLYCTQDHDVVRVLAIPGPNMALRRAELVARKKRLRRPLVSKDGLYLFGTNLDRSDNDVDLFRIDLVGHRYHEVFRGDLRGPAELAMAPDGRVLMSARSAKSSQRGLWLLADGENRLESVDIRGPVREPTFSPDGTSLIFLRPRPKRVTEVWRTDWPPDKASPRLLLQVRECHNPCVTPDGTRLIFTGRNKDGSTYTAVSALNGGSTARTAPSSNKARHGSGAIRERSHLGSARHRRNRRRSANRRTLHPNKRKLARLQPKSHQR